MRARRIRNVSYYIAWTCLIILQPLHALASDEGAANPDVWIKRTAIAAAIAIIGYLLKRAVDAIDRLSDSVNHLTLETQKNRIGLAEVKKETQISRKQLNVVNDWRHKHDNLHAQCRECPVAPV